MRKTYAEHCLEVSQNVTKCRWKKNIHIHLEHGYGATAYPCGPEGDTLPWDQYYGDRPSHQTVIDAEFIASSPQMVMDLARRLNISTDSLRQIATAIRRGIHISDKVIDQIAESLEEIPKLEGPIL